MLAQQVENSYEVMFIIKPLEDDDKISATIDKFEKLITDNNGNIDKTDRWGKKHLAYQIDDFDDGIYVLITFTATPKAVKELDRVMKIDDNILRHMIIRAAK